MIVIVSCAIENILFYFFFFGGGGGGVGVFWLMIMIVCWTIKNNLVYLRSILVYDYDSLLGY